MTDMKWHSKHTDNYELFGLTFPNSTTINTLIFSLNFTMISSETLSVLDIESSQKDQWLYSWVVVYDKLE
jgi:hypothetical protein